MTFSFRFTVFCIFSFAFVSLIWTGTASVSKFHHNEAPQSFQNDAANRMKLNEEMLVYGDYADRAYQTFIQTMYNPSTEELRAVVNGSKPSYYWNTAVAFQSLLHYGLYNSKEQPNIIRLIYKLIDSQVKLSNQSDAYLRNNYNDDMSWMIHGLTALYDETKNQTLINMAEFLHSYIRTSEDTTCCGNMKGGLWWDRKHTQKATAAQAGATLAGLRIMETGAKTSWTAKQWLTWSIQNYQFWRDNMVNNQTGEVCDNISKQGEKHWLSFDYNEGLMIGCAVHLYRATNNSAYLKDAALFTQHLINIGVTVIVNNTKVVILADDNRPSCSGDASEFHEVAFHYLTEYYQLLLQLNEKHAAMSLYQFLKGNIDSLWINARNPTTGVFNCNWDKPFSSGTDGLQGAMNQAVSALSLFAALPAPSTVSSY